MALLDDLRALAELLPGEAKPVAAEVVDVLGAVVRVLEHHGLHVPPAIDSPPAAVADAPPPGTAAEAAPAPAAEPPAAEPPTVGSQVADVAANSSPAAGPSAVSSSAVSSADELEQQLRAKSDELDALRVQLADAQKTQLAPNLPPVE